ncbi:glycosyltransferase [Rapidithrix thailandica]|uniref:Glycosyltransferase n=1 Tax=Rapidithrix thailandica TaxID=413964 RepID=A0AAW9S8C1_9BACT
MKIAFLAPFYPYRGGIAQSSTALYKALESLAEVKAFNFSLQYPSLLFPGSSQFENAKDSNLKIDSVRCLNSINPLSYFTTANKIQGFQPDLLLTRYWMPFFAPSLGLVSKLVRKKGARVISITDNIIPHEHRMGDQVLTSFFLKQNDGFVTLSEAVKRDLLQFRPNAKVLFHPHPLYSHFGKKQEKAQARKLLQLPKERKIILFFGLIRAYKGLDTLLEAFGKLDASYHLLVAGEAYEDMEKYQALIAQNPNRDRVQMHNHYIAESEVPNYFSAADVCVLPYKTATQSGVTAISFHFDLPVIVTDVGGLKQMVGEFEGGGVVPPENPDQLAKRIQEYFHHNQQEQYSQAIQKNKKTYSWEHLAVELIRFSEGQAR